jgi:hypothetical protein
MKTITNLSKNVRTLARSWDEDSGEYDYFFLTASGKRRIKQVTTKFGTADSSSYYGDQVRRGKLVGQFTTKEVDVSDDCWTKCLGPGQKVEVPTHRETFAQHASRTGEFRVGINRALAKST